MRSTVMLAAAFLLLLPKAAQTQPKDEARALIGKAVKVMGYDKEPAEFKGFRTKSKGTLEVNGMNLNFSQTVLIRMPNQFKDVMELDVNNMKIPVVTVFDGKKGWVQVNGKVMQLDDKVAAELKEVAGLIKIGRLTPLLDKKYELTLIGDVKVENKPAVGIRVASEGAKDFSLFFDKQTGYLVKMERQSIDAATGQEVQEERVVRSYQDKNGRKIPHQVAVYRNGKKFLDAEVSEYELLNDVDAGEFDAPK